MELKRVFRILKEETKYQNPWLIVKELTTEKGGKQGIYGVVHRSDTSTLIIESTNHSILFLKQYRFPTNSYGWELPMGGIETDEESIDAASRELSEETGISIQLRKLGEFHPAPGLTPQKVFVFCGEISDLEVQKVIDFNEQVDEIIERRFFSYEEISSMIKNGEISDGFTLSSLSLLKWR